MALPNPGLRIDPTRTAVVITDPQNDFLSPDGLTWGVVGPSVIENNTVENLESLMRIAHEERYAVLVSPHYYYPTDRGWKFGGAIETLMHDLGMFERSASDAPEVFAGSGADWHDRLKPYINAPGTVVVSPHKVLGPESNDLVLQLRKQRIEQVVLAGMSANLCTESHLRALIEHGFEVAVVQDATAAAVIHEGDGNAAAAINFRFLASAVWKTEEAVRELIRASRKAQR